MNLSVFKRRKAVMPLAERVQKIIEIGLKCLILLAFPVPPTALATLLWYVLLCKPGIHFGTNMENIVTQAWIPTFSIIYGLFAAVVLNGVWGEYKAMRMAIKKYDVETFVDLRDEDVSPLIHTLMFVLALMVLAGFAGLAYPNTLSGALAIASSSYVFGLAFFIVREIDDPLAGFWFIRNIHEEWLSIDPKRWRAEKREKLIINLRAEVVAFTSGKDAETARTS